MKVIAIILGMILITVLYADPVQPTPIPGIIYSIRGHVIEFNSESVSDPVPAIPLCYWVKILPCPGCSTPLPFADWIYGLTALKMAILKDAYERGLVVKFSYFKADGKTWANSVKYSSCP
jgi:hypothetical protein